MKKQVRSTERFRCINAQIGGRDGIQLLGWVKHELSQNRANTIAGRLRFDMCGDEATRSGRKYA